MIQTPAALANLRRRVPLWVLGLVAFGGAAGVGIGLGLSALTASNSVAVIQTLLVYAHPLIRTALDLCAAAVVGLSLLPKLLGFDRPNLTEPVMRIVRRVAVVMAALWAGTAALSVVIRAYEARPDYPLTLPNIVDYVRKVGAGQGLLFSCICALVLVFIGIAAVRHGERVPAELRILVALLGLLPLPITGHAANWKYHDYSMVSMELHVVAAAMWTGGLAALIAFTASRNALLAIAIPKFSRLATIAIAIVVATGLFNGFLELILSPRLEFWTALFTTAYGAVLVGKIVSSIAIAIVGAQIRWRLLPAIADGKAIAIAGWAGCELAIMGIAFGLAVVLSAAPVG